ncbi:MAG: YbaB/EbfC family nucleoid-associated protein [Phycisphaerales bacterium]|nr:YbaB/EbfC family nucleoid-associated protein [Phycisphaerales bacterium]
MFGNLGQLMGLLKNADKIKANMKDMQERLGALRFVGDAGAGQVQATVDGRGEPVSLKIDPGLFAGGDREMVEELVCASFRQAIQKSREGMQKEMSAAMGGLDLSQFMGTGG